MKLSRLLLTQTLVGSALVHQALFLLLLIEGIACSNALVRPSCEDFTKGNFGPKTIVSNAICQEACQTSEGLPVGDYNEDTETDFRKCSCLLADDGSSSSVNREICRDGSSANQVVTGIVLGLASTITVMLLSN